MLWREYIENERFDESENTEFIEEYKEELKNEIKYYKKNTLIMDKTDNF